MKRYLAAGIFLIAVLVGSILYFRSLAPSEFVSMSSSKVKGNIHAPVEIIEYSNFKCSHCKEIQPTLTGILKKYPAKVKIVFRHYPATNDQSSLWAHIAAECAAHKGKFWEYHDQLFEHQLEWSTSPEPLKYFIQYARDVGLDTKQFSDCILDESVLKKVHEEDLTGIQLRFNITPSFVINGESFAGVQQFKTGGVQKIEAELRKKGLL